MYLHILVRVLSVKASLYSLWVHSGLGAWVSRHGRRASNGYPLPQSTQRSTEGSSWTQGKQYRETKEQKMEV